MKEKVHDVKLNWDAYVIIDPNAPKNWITNLFVSQLFVSQLFVSPYFYDND